MRSHGFDRIPPREESRAGARWQGGRRAWLILVLTAALAACGGKATPRPAAVAGVTPKPGAVSAAAQLRIQSSPAGATVTIDGQARGSSPLSLALSPGPHRVVTSADGYAPLTETITLTAGLEGLYSPTLVDNAPPVVTLAADPQDVPWFGHATLHATATDPGGVAELQLLLDGDLLGASEDGDLTLDFAPAETPGLSPGGHYTLLARAADGAGNAGQVSLDITVGQMPKPTEPGATATRGPAPTATTAVLSTATEAPLPTATPVITATTAPAAAPTNPPQPAEVTSLHITSIVLPTYPFTPYLHSAVDPNLGNYPLLVLDRPAYEAANPQPVPITYTLLVLENKYLRLSILPDLGGRVYECTFKPTGHNEFYSNPVVKPTGWGPPDPPYPTGANWWLALGGLEWEFPVEEHGYEWANRWGYDHVALPSGGVMISLFTREWRRPYAVVDITLEPEAAYFTVSPHITNPNAITFRFKWWDNAMLAPGAANAPGPDLRFIVPTGEVSVHSTADPSLPGAGQAMSWPVFDGRDMSRLGNWKEYLGFFARPAAQANYAGVYDSNADEGMLRVFPADVVRGVKVFGAGWGQPLDPKNWTDDGSGYIELHGGLAPTFADAYDLPAGQSIGWIETWYPVAGIGGVMYAAVGGALNLAPTGTGLRVSLFPNRPVRGQLRVAIPGMDPVTRAVDIDPARLSGQEFAYGSDVPAEGEVSVTLTNAQGQTVLAYKGRVTLK